MKSKISDLTKLALKTTTFEGGHVSGVERFEKQVNDFLQQKEAKQIFLSTYNRIAWGMNMLDYRVLVRYLDQKPEKAFYQIKILEEAFGITPVARRIDSFMTQKLREGIRLELEDIQSVIYEVEAPGRGMGGKDIVQHAVYMLVYRVSGRERVPGI